MRKKKAAGILAAVGMSLLLAACGDVQDTVGNAREKTEKTETTEKKDKSSEKADSSEKEKEESSIPESSILQNGILDLQSGETMESDIPLDSEHFPDPDFRRYLSDAVDTNGDGKLSYEERGVEVMYYNAKGHWLRFYYADDLYDFFSAKLSDFDRARIKIEDYHEEPISFDQAMTGLEKEDYEEICVFCESLVDIYGENYQMASDLQGIEWFYNLKSLYCSGDNLTKLDVSGCSSLQELYCSGNQLTKLDVSGCSSLMELYCFGNQLTELDLSSCEKLLWVICPVDCSLEFSAKSRIESQGITDSTDSGTFKVIKFLQD